jgi:Na+/proline symporter
VSGDAAGPDASGPEDPTGRPGSARPDDPRHERYRRLSMLLRVALGLVSALSLLAVLLPEDQGLWFARVAVGLLIAVPLLRVAWFVARWFRRGDTRFAMVGVGVLCVVAVGWVLS